MTLFLAQRARLLPLLSYNSCAAPRLQRIPSQLPVISKRVHDYRVFRCCVNGGLDAESGDKATSPALKTSEDAANSDALNSEKLTAQTAGEEPWAILAESRVERTIFNFRFLTLMAITGSLGGSLICFLKGCGFVYEAYHAFIQRYLYGMHTGTVILRLVESVEIYLVGTVLLIFAMGFYGLFISNEYQGGSSSSDRAFKNTTLFGMFPLTTRPQWMKITTLDSLKSKLGHCIVMILVVKLFEKSKTVSIASPLDLLMYSVSIFLASGALYLLQKMHVLEYSEA